jgi:hypothetical protein
MVEDASIRLAGMVTDQLRFAAILSLRMSVTLNKVTHGGSCYWTRRRVAVVWNLRFDMSLIPTD